MADQPKIYVGCSLTQAPQAFKDAVESLKNSLRADYQILDFVGLEAGTATDVYNWDVKHCVGGCDLFVAICDYPAIGLGYELATAIEKLNKPVLAVAQEKAIVTRLVLGIDAPTFSLERYQDMGDVVALVKAKLASL
jgi:hypothetical protein